MKRIQDITGCKEYVREHADLYQIISEDIGDVEWKEESGNTLVCNSPFRNETKPSFKVSGKRFKDWGGEQYGGDIFAWLQIWHGVSFEESVIMAASRNNIDISSYMRDPTPQELELGKFKKANRVAAEFMHKLLLENKIIRDNYLSSSNFTIDQIKPYQVGYCPSNEVLISHVAREVQLTDNDIHRLEFSRQDLFTDALVYPIHNHSGEVAYFYTKQLNVDGAPYKSVRHEHPLYSHDILYGMHEARKHIRSNKGQLVIVEGFRDAIALKAAGVMGGAINNNQIKALQNYKINSLVICYDGDYPGWTKTVELVNKPDDFGDMLVLIARPPIDKDPHDTWKEGGDEAVYSMINNAKVPIEYYIETNFDGNLSLTDKQKILTDLKDYLTKVTGVQLDVTATYLAQILGSSRESIIDYVAEIKANYSELFNLEAERTLIANCMKISASFSASRSAGVQPKAFTLSHYQRLFESCRIAYDKYGENYTPQVVLDETMARHPNPELPSIVSHIMEDSYKYTEVAACEIVLDMWRRRVASEQASELITSSRDLSVSFREVVDSHRKGLISTVSSVRQQARTPSELSKELFSVVKERSQTGGDLIIGYNIGGPLDTINLMLGGIQKGHLVTIAGDTGAGKSILAMNIAKCIAIDANEPLLWIGQEMQSYENTMRLASIITDINNTKLQTGNLNKRESELFAQAVSKIENSGFYMAKPSEGNIDEILSIIDEYRWKYGIKAVIYDYIGLLTRSPDQNRMSREEILGHASTTLKNRVAEDMGLAMILIAQMNRDKHAEGKQKIAGSYRIIQDSDDFLWIEEKTEKQIAQDGKAQGNRYIRIGKRRGGVSKYVANAYLDVEPATASLTIKETNSPSEIGALYAKLTATAMTAA